MRTGTPPASATASPLPPSSTRSCYGCAGPRSSSAGSRRTFPSRWVGCSPPTWPRHSRCGRPVLRPPLPRSTLRSQRGGRTAASRDDADRITTAVRVFHNTERVRASPGITGYAEPPGSRPSPCEYPHEALGDTETLPEPAQQLRFLVWRFDRDPPDRKPGLVCTEEGIAYPDDLAKNNPRDWQLLQRYTARKKAQIARLDPTLKVVPLSWWMEERFFRYGWAHRDRCSIVGFNLLFDMAASPATGERPVASTAEASHLPSRGRFDADGKWHDRKYRGRVRARALDPRRTLFG